MSQEKDYVLKVPLCRKLANALMAYKTCVRDGNTEWAEYHLARLIKTVRENLPHGSGFDSDPEIDVEASREDRLVFRGSFHAMNSDGYYTRWYDFRVIARPSFLGSGGVDVRVRSSDRLPADLRELIDEAYYEALSAMVPLYEKTDA